MAESRTVWQIGGGPTSRSYVELFVQYGVGLIGPGDAGSWNPSRDNSEYDGSPVRQFAVELQRGDILLLRSSSARVTEDEVVGRLVIPLLRALGWPPERIGIKWRYIDVALFTALPRTPENCRFVVEAKSLGSGVEGALEQARGYVETLGVPRDIVVTDGLRYRRQAITRRLRGQRRNPI